MNNILINKGMTLAEVVIATAGVLLLGIAIATFGKSIWDNNTFISGQLSARGEFVRAEEVFIRDARGIVVPHTGVYPIATTTKDTLIFYSDIGNDGLIDQVKYALDPSTNELQRVIVVPTGTPLGYDLSNAATKTLVHNISTTTIFKYYDKTYNGYSATGSIPVSSIVINEIKILELQLEADEDINEPPTATTGLTRVFIRSLKENE